ncbi:hypothetical protein THRCLA_03361 [Thraustotheca clavata]|uniref:Uncharacterized protein n=1 Tax=Thraustotheca clavata TaxID=74557 RepID=A0A1W0A2B7_9STRA|nr:hypothetical protein THRCLA_03361 [Thraustotheca clavata]
MNSKYSTSVQILTQILKNWEPRVLQIDGQQISILKKGVVKTILDFKNGSVIALASNNQLKITTIKGQHITIAAPSPLIHSQLFDLLTQAATSATWKTPVVTFQDKLLSVVESVRSTSKIAPSCSLTVTEIQEHLKAIKIMYDRLQIFDNPLDLYSHLLDLESTYVRNYRDFVASNATQPHSLAHTVYQLHPLLYSLGVSPHKLSKSTINDAVAVCINCKRELDSNIKWKIFIYQCEAQCNKCGEYQISTSYYKSHNGTKAFDIPLRQVLGKCPHRTCSYHFTPNEMYRIHILDDAVECPQCHNSILYETFQIAMFIRQCPNIDYTSHRLNGGSLEWRFDTPNVIPKDGLWSTYSQMMEEAIQNDPHQDDMEGIPLFRDIAQMAMIEKYCQPSGAFAVDIVQGMYRQLNFIAKIGPVVQYWAQPTVIEAAIQRYEQFVYLYNKNPNLQAVPTIDIALVWQTHLTKRNDYVKYSREVTKQVLPYFDAPTPTNIEDNYVKTSVAWSKLYKLPYSSFVPQNMSVLSIEKVGAIVPQGESRFYGVDELVLASDMNIKNSSVEKIMVPVMGCPSFDNRVYLEGSKVNELLVPTRGKEHKRSIAKNFITKLLLNTK